MFEEIVVIDGKGHVFGRLASVCAKQALAGQKIVVIRCEEIVMSGSLRRNVLTFEDFKQIRTGTNHRRGPFHHRAPTKIFQRAIRGMINYKHTKGITALDRIQCFEGCPRKYFNIKKMCVPRALVCHCIRPESKRTVLKDLCSTIGWKRRSIIEKLETKRIQAGHEFHKTQLSHFAMKAEAIAKARKDAKFQTVEKKLAEMGF